MCQWEIANTWNEFKEIGLNKEREGVKSTKWNIRSKKYNWDKLERKTLEQRAEQQHQEDRRICELEDEREITQSEKQRGKNERSLGYL